MDRRVYFFAIAAAIALVITPLAPKDFRWVGVTVVATYVVLALLFLADSLARQRRRNRPL